jgi:hypothetical protein
MKARVVTMAGRMQFEVEASSAKELFKEIAHLQEVFDEPCCGVCGGREIRLAVRVAEGETGVFDYHELHCACGARLAFGQTRDGKGLFPKRKDPHGNWTKTNGWFLFDYQTNTPVFAKNVIGGER